MGQMSPCRAAAINSIGGPEGARGLVAPYSLREEDMEKYRLFIDALSKGIEGEIVGYDVQSSERCVVYLDAERQAISIDREVIEQAGSEAIFLLREKIREGLIDRKSMSLTLHSGSLVVQYVE